MTQSEVNNHSILLPINLSLTVDGFGGYTTGDMFRIDYLPRRYRDRIFFQTIKVTHNVDNTTWSTTLEAKMRILPAQVKQVLAKSALINIKPALSKFILSDSLSLSGIQPILPYIKYIKPFQAALDYAKEQDIPIDSVWTITTNSEMEDVEGVLWGALKNNLQVTMFAPKRGGDYKFDEDDLKESHPKYILNRAWRILVNKGICAEAIAIKRSSTIKNIDSSSGDVWVNTHARIGLNLKLIKNTTYMLVTWNGGQNWYMWSTSVEGEVSTIIGAALVNLRYMMKVTGKKLDEEDWKAATKNSTFSAARVDSSAGNKDMGPKDDKYTKSPTQKGLIIQALKYKVSQELWVGPDANILAMAKERYNALDRAAYWKKNWYFLKTNQFSKIKE